MTFPQYLEIRRTQVQKIVITETPYKVAKYTCAREVFGDDVYIAFDDVSETDRKFILGVLSHLGGIEQCMSLNSNIHSQYIDILFDIAEDLYKRAIEGILTYRTWFKTYALNRGIVSECNGRILRTSEYDDRSLYWDVFTRYFFGWYSEWTW